MKTMKLLILVLSLALILPVFSKFNLYDDNAEDDVALEEERSSESKISFV